PSPPRVLLSVEEAAQALSLGRTYVWPLVMLNELRSFKVGRKCRIPVSALHDFVERRLSALEQVRTGTGGVTMPSKRGNGEGSICKRADGRWIARITLEGGERKTFYAKTRQEAARRLAAAIRDRDTGVPIVGERQTVEQYLSIWLSDIRPTIRPRSW